MAKRKEQPIPDDLLAMTIEELTELDRSRGIGSEEWQRNIQERDEAVRKVEEYGNRSLLVKRALLEKLKAAAERKK